MFHGPPPGARFQYAKVTPPKNIADVPRYLGELLGGFFTRMGYIFKLVWKTGPWILFAMLFFAVFQGVMPVVGSKISEAVLNELQSQYGLFDGDFAGFFGTSVFFLLVFMFTYNILTNIVNTLKNTVTRIAGELVVRTVKLEIRNWTSAPSISPPSTRSWRTPTARRVCAPSRSSPPPSPWSVTSSPSFPSW